MRAPRPGNRRRRDRRLRGRRDRAAVAVALGLAGGWVADRLIGDPRRGHPVALLGRCAAWLERRVHHDHRGAGAVHWALVVVPPTLVVAVIHRAARHRLPWLVGRDPARLDPGGITGR